MSITNGEGTLNMGGIIYYYYYFTALGEAYGGALYSLESVFFSFCFFYMLLYHTWTLFPCKIGNWDAFVSIFQFD